MLQAHEAPVVAAAGELDAAILQAAVTAGLAILFAALYRKTRKPLFQWFSVAWGLYFVRVGAIIAFLRSANWAWLYWHQVLTGWTALALLGGALVLRAPTSRRRWFPWLALFPLAWSYFAVYVLDSFLLAAGPAVLFLSAITLLTGAIVWRYGRPTRAPGAGLLSISLLLWGVHHLDYPFLRARGAWAPWGYYLDIMFTFLVGAGGLMLLLAERAADLELLQRRMVGQHEEERRQLSLHLHDETAQVFTALRLRLGLMRERAVAGDAEELDRTLELLDDGLAGIRGITNELRPSLLDDIGLMAALRALAEESAERFGLQITARLPEVLPTLARDAELALYRGLQEMLSNAAAHASARTVDVEVSLQGNEVHLRVRDDGQGFLTGTEVDGLSRAGHLGLAGMRERLVAQGGRLTIASEPKQGAIVTAVVPVDPAMSPDRR